MLRAPLAATTNTADKQTWLRPYSPYWVDANELEFKILVNLKPQGPMSRYIAQLQAGDEAEFRGPIGVYTHTAVEQVPKYVFIVSQGVAIAPTLPIIKQILDNEDDMSRIYQLACFRDVTHIYFRSTLLDFNGYWNYKSNSYVAHQQCGSAECAAAGGCDVKCANFAGSLRYKESVLPRRLQAEELQEICGNVDGAMEKRFIVCGTRLFQETIVEMIKQLDVPVKDEHIFLL